MEAEFDTTYLLALARLFPPQGKWTEHDYFALPESNSIIELSDGELEMPPPASDAHQNAAGNLYYKLRQFVEQYQLGIVRFAPMPVRLSEGKIREPDVLFLRAEHLDRVGDHVYGPPDWVAEVLSPSTRNVDEGEKLHEYAQAGVPEYWLVDPKDRIIRVYVLPEGKDVYTLAAKYTADQTARSETLSGFEVIVGSIV